MANLFSTDLQIHERYDLKGSTAGRTAGKDAVARVRARGGGVCAARPWGAAVPQGMRKGGRDLPAWRMRAAPTLGNVSRLLCRRSYMTQPSRSRDHAPENRSRPAPAGCPAAHRPAHFRTARPPAPHPHAGTPGGPSGCAKRPGPGGALLQTGGPVA
jgi:hypothetical protein